MLGNIKTLAEMNDPTAASGEEWEEYAELIERENLSTAQAKKLASFAAKFGISREEAELHKIVLATAAGYEEVLKGDEDQARAGEESAVKAEAQARKGMLDEICRLQTRLLNNEFPEVAMTLRARDQLAAFQNARNDLIALHSRWPQLFGLPKGKKPSSGWCLPHNILTAMDRLKLGALAQ